MNKFNHTIKGVVLSGAVLALAGCGIGDSGPSSHTVKKLAATHMINLLMSMAEKELQVEKIWGTSSPTYVKHEAIFKKLIKNKAHILHEYENQIHFNGCTKSGKGSYRCSVSFHDKKSHKEDPFIVMVDKAGSTWVLNGMKAA